MPEFYRDCVLPWGLLRWVNFDCGGKDCAGHKTGILGLDICGTMRWTVLVERVENWAVGAEQRWEAMLADMEEALVVHYRRVGAALGMSWDYVGFERCKLQSMIVSSLAPEIILEMSAQGEEALLNLRRLAGNDIGAVLALLEGMGAYRENVGGMPAREGWQS